MSEEVVTKKARFKKVRSVIKKAYKNRLVKVIVLLVLAVGLLVGAYYIGDRHGAKRQSDYYAKHPTSAAAKAFLNQNNPTALGHGLRHWSAIGTVTEATDKVVKIKDSRGEIKEAAVNKDTVVTVLGGKKTDLKSLKNGQRVIITGTKDENGTTQTATRIRIQK